MRRSTPDRRRRLARLAPTIGRRIALLLVLVTTFGGLLVTTQPQTVTADELSDAYARQKALQRLIAQQKASIAALSANQTRLSAKLSDTEHNLSAINANLQSVKTQIVAMVVDVASAEAQVDEINATSARLDAELQQIEADEAKKSADLDAQKALLAERIVDTYDGDRTSALDSFLSGDDFTDVLTQVGDQVAFAEQDKVLADQIGQDQQVLDQLHQSVLDAQAQTDQLHDLAAQSKAKLDQQLAALAAARAQLNKLEAQTQALLAQQQAQYAKLARDKAKLKAMLAAALKAQQQLEALIARLVAEQLRKGGIPSVYNGTLIWPMGGTITQEFGCTGFWAEPPLGNCAHFHRGIDIATAKYTPIRAAGAGKVIWAGKSPYDPAWIVIIAHSSHLVSWYGHVDNRVRPPAVHAGQYVAQGQVIAYEGCTGMCTGPHLHWAVQLNGTWVNPRLFLPR